MTPLPLAKAYASGRKRENKGGKLSRYGLKVSLNKL
jgi:hypothetical protein